MDSDETEICHWNQKFGHEAICCDRIDMLEFALKNGYKFSSEACELALQDKARGDYYYGRGR